METPEPLRIYAPPPTGCARGIMLTLFFSICMYKIAEREKRRPWLWGALTFAVSAAIQHLLIAGYWGAVAGLMVSFGAMTAANIWRPVGKGPFPG